MNAIRAEDVDGPHVSNAAEMGCMIACAQEIGTNLVRVRQQVVNEENPWMP